MPPSKPLTLVLSSSHDAMDVNAFSTTIFRMASALKEEVPDLEIVRFPRPFLHRRAVRSVLRRLPALNPINRDYFLRFCAWRFAKRFKGRRVVVISIVDSPLAIFLSERLPVINVSDATHALLEGSYYGVYDSIPDRESAFRHRAEYAAIHSLHACFSSNWAMESAVRDYGGDPESLSVISWGCNLPEVSKEQARLTVDDESCRLLFVAAQWKRKGGQVVLEAARLLHQRGISVSVDLVGVTPEDSFPKGVNVIYHGRLTKDDPVKLARMMDLYRTATVLVLPTEQDCTPMVFAEANAFGTPAVTCDIGGISDVVRDGENGRVLRTEAAAEDYADAIAALWQDRRRYEALRRSSRDAYEQRLNWRAWARGMVALVRSLEAQGKI